MNKRNNHKLKRAVRGLLRVLIVGAIIYAYLLINSIADELRGYDATGGEILMFVIPFIIVVGKKCFDDMIDSLKK